VRAARTATTVLISAVLALGAASCGGSEVEYDEVPGPPADVSIPSDTSTLEGSGDTTGASGDATPTPTPDAAVPEDQSGAAGTDTAAATQPSAPTSDGTTDTGATAPDSGGSTAPAEPDGPSNDTAPPAGSEAEQFEAFCAENPGAC
jgi:hypothetical protein